MFKNKIYTLFVILGVVIGSCTEMDDNFNQYVENGEIEYSNKVDSIKTFSGKNRATITASLFNAITVKEVIVSWDRGENMMSFPYQKSENDIDELELIIPDLEEKSYQLSVYTKDSQGAESIKVDAFVNVFGESYRSNLVAKAFKSTRANADSLAIELSISSSLERNTEFKYFDKTTGDEVVVTTMPGDANVVLRNVDFTKTIQHHTFYVPEEDAIDEFDSDWVEFTFPQNIIDVFNSLVITTIRGGINLFWQNTLNRDLTVELTYFVNGVAKTSVFTSSDLTGNFDATGFAAGLQDVTIGIKDVGANEVVRTFAVEPIAFLGLDRSAWTIHSFKTQTVNAKRAWGAIRVIDNDINTLWRSAWPTSADSEFPQWIIIDMQEDKTMDAIKIKGPANGKGHSKHTWEISSDGINFTPIGTFDMANISTHQTNDLAAPATGRYLRYTAIEPGTVKSNSGGNFYCDYVYDIHPGAYEQ